MEQLIHIEINGPPDAPAGRCHVGAAHPPFAPGDSHTSAHVRMPGLA